MEAGRGRRVGHGGRREGGRRERGGWGVIVFFIECGAHMFRLCGKIRAFGW